MQEKIIILDFGSQTTQLIARRVRELNTYCEIVPYNKFPHNDPSIIGVILSGSPFSVYDESAFKVDLSDIRGKYPILGICYGAQFTGDFLKTVNNIVLFSETWKARLDAMNKEQEALTEQAQQAVLEEAEAPEPSFAAGQFLRV